jgi:hypothetical protein
MAWGSSVFARISATNAYGTSSFSTAGNGAIIVTVPDAPVNLLNNAAQTTTNKISIYWTKGSSEGGLTVLDYTVSWDQGTGIWVVR